MLLTTLILSFLGSALAVPASPDNDAVRRGPPGSYAYTPPGRSSYPSRPAPPWPAPSGPSPFPNRNPRSCQYRSYTALGDSYSAGLNYANNLLLPACDGSGKPCNGGDVCLRNADAFPMLLQAAHNFSSFQFNACSGANTTECDDTQVHGPSYGSPDLVTITIGGDNNQAFLGLIVNCVYQRDDTYCQYAIQNAQATVAGLDPYLKTLFRDIVSTNFVFNRRVAVVGYPKLWSAANSTTCQHPVLSNVPLADRQAMNDLADGVNAVLKKAADAMGFGFTYVNVDPAFEGKRLCDNVADPLFQYDFATSLYGVFHPTERGQQVLFKAVESAVGCAA